MDDTSGYAVYFFPPALESLGEAIKPYLHEGPGGMHLLCREIDTGGSLIEMTLDGLDAVGKPVQLEMMIPSNMVRMIVSARSDGAFGFGPRMVNPAMDIDSEHLPPIGPTATPVDAPSEALPETTQARAPQNAPAPDEPPA